MATAMLAGGKSLEAVAQFGRDHGPALAHALGFRSRHTPCKATPSDLLRRLDPAAVERAVADWMVARCPDLGDHLCLDGKSARGTRAGSLPAVHLLAAYAPRVAGVLAQVRVAAKTNEHKAALELLGVLPVAGRVVTGDAMFCHRDGCETLTARGGDSLPAVKGNQPTPHFDPAAMFRESQAFSPLPASPVAG